MTDSGFLLKNKSFPTAIDRFGIIIITFFHAVSHVYKHQIHARHDNICQQWFSFKKKFH